MRHLQIPTLIRKGQVSIEELITERDALEKQWTAASLLHDGAKKKAIRLSWLKNRMYRAFLSGQKVIERETREIICEDYPDLK